MKRPVWCSVGPGGATGAVGQEAPLPQPGERHGRIAAPDGFDKSDRVAALTALVAVPQVVLLAAELAAGPAAIMLVGRNRAAAVEAGARFVHFKPKCFGHAADVEGSEHVLVGVHTLSSSPVVRPGLY